MKSTDAPRASLIRGISAAAVQTAQRRMLLTALGQAAQKRRARVAAWLLSKQIRRFGAAPEAAARKSAVRALILPKHSFSQDISESLGRDPRFDVFALDREAVQLMGRAFLPPAINDFTYRSDDPEVLAAMTSYRAFLREVWRHVQREHAFDVVLSGNFAYWAEQELAAALEESGTRFVVLFKECLNTPGLERFWEWVFREWRVPFAGSRILVYNEGARGLLSRAGIAPFERIAVTGMPRLDRQLRWRSTASAPPSLPTRKQVLFLLFGPTTALPEIPSKRRVVPDELTQAPWPLIAEQTFRCLHELAEQHPSVRFLVKAKQDVRAHASILARYFQEHGRWPRNVVVVTSGDVEEHLLNSTVVCGLKSTALLEAVAAHRPVVMPRFAEAETPAAAEFYLELGAAVTYARSPAQLKEAISAHLLGEVTPVDVPTWESLVAPQLESWLGNADGKAGARVCSELVELLAAS